MKPLFKTKQKPLKQIEKSDIIVGAGGDRSAINPKSRLLDATTTTKKAAAKPSFFSKIFKL